MIPERPRAVALIPHALYWASTFYPLFIAAQLWVRVLPAYLQGWLWGGQVGAIRLDPYFIMAGFRGGLGAGGPLRAQLLLAAVTVAALVLMALVRRRGRDLAGRMLVLIGLSLSSGWLSAALYFNRPSTRGAIPALLGLALLAAGMRWAAATLPGGYWARVAVIQAGFVLPAGLLPLLRSERNRPWFGIVTTVPLLALAALVQFGITPAAKQVRLRSAGIGLLASSILFAALMQGRQWQQKQHVAEIERTLASLPRPQPGQEFQKLYFHRGVSFTANGFGYESAEARSLLARLPEFGIQSIAVVPYGGMDRETLRMTTARPETWESDAGVEIITASAHGLGMQVMLKPHIWRPRDDRTLSERERDVWFREYTAFIEHYARLAQRMHAETLCIGVELGRLTQFEAQWRDLIARVRRIYKGPLVHAASHGTDFESVRFWDALDYIGLDNFYPLPDDYSAEEIVKKVEAVAERHNRPVLLTEAGYSSAAGAHRTPWADRPPSPLSLEEQVRCYEATLAAFYEKPWFVGVYWWKVETDGAGGAADNSMSPWGKPAMQTIRKWYSRPARFHEPGPDAVTPPGQ